MGKFLPNSCICHFLAHTDCTVCGKTFSGKNGKRTLMRHMKKHQNIKKTICEFCNKDLKNPWNLKRHQINACKLKPKQSLDIIAIKPKSIKPKLGFLLPKPNLDIMESEPNPNLDITEYELNPNLDTIESEPESNFDTIESEFRPNMEIIDVKPNLDIIPIKPE